MLALDLEYQYTPRDLQPLPCPVLSISAKSVLRGKPLVTHYQRDYNSVRLTCATTDIVCESCVFPQPLD